MKCNYCQGHDRFWIFHPADTTCDPRERACGEHLAIGVDEVTHAMNIVEALVIVNEPS